MLGKRRGEKSWALSVPGCGGHSGPRCTARLGGGWRAGGTGRPAQPVGGVSPRPFFGEGSGTVRGTKQRPRGGLSSAGDEVGGRLPARGVPAPGWGRHAVPEAAPPGRRSREGLQKTFPRHQCQGRWMLAEPWAPCHAPATGSPHGGGGQGPLPHPRTAWASRSPCALTSCCGLTPRACSQGGHRACPTASPPPPLSGAGRRHSQDQRRWASALGPEGPPGPPGLSRRREGPRFSAPVGGSGRRRTAAPTPGACVCLGVAFSAVAFWATRHVRI